MDKNFFTTQVEKLRGTYSPGALNETRIQLWWDRFKGVPNLVFENAVNYLISESTSQQLPALSKFSDAVGMFRSNPNGATMQEYRSPFACEPCRDFGFGFVGDTVVKCVCPAGDKISPAELARQQGNYDRGAQYMGKLKQSIGQELPYDSSERIGEWE